MSSGIRTRKANARTDNEENEDERQRLLAGASDGSSNSTFSDPGRPKTRKEKLIRAAETGFWIALAVAVVYFGDILGKVQAYHKQPSFIVAAISLAVFFGVFMYIQYYLPLIRKRRIDLKNWNVESPGLIQVATLAGVSAFVSFCVFFWEFYHLASPLVVFIIMMGSLSVTSLF